MIYEYQNFDTGEVIEVDLPMNEEHPSVITRNGKQYRRLFGSTAVTIPEDWGRDSFRFDKRPRDKRKYK